MANSGSQKGSHSAKEESTVYVEYTAEDFANVTGFRVDTYKNSDMIKLTLGASTGTGFSFGEALRALKENVGVHPKLE